MRRPADEHSPLEYGGRVSAELYERLNDRSLTNEQLLRAVLDVIDNVAAL